MKQILQEAKVYLNCTQEHNNQTADYWCNILSIKGLSRSLECYRNSIKLLLTLKIILKIVQQETQVCLNHAQEHGHLLIVSIKEEK